MPAEPTTLADRFLSVIEDDVVPKTRAGVAAGNKLFGAAILRKSDLSLVVAATNTETENPLFHGEIATLNAFYRLPAASRPAARDCLFLSTHEPCPLCLSAITWTGFDNFTYLFGYEFDARRVRHPARFANPRRSVRREGRRLPARERVLEGARARRLRGRSAGAGA